MKSESIPIILLTVFVIILAAGLIYYIQLYSEENGGNGNAPTDGSTNGNGGSSIKPDFSCKLPEYADTDACLYVDLQITDVEIPQEMKTDLPQTIKVTLYNAGKDSTTGYEVRHFYYDSSKKVREEIGTGSSVPGIHNSGQEKTVYLTWVPAITGRYRYIIQLYQIDEAGMVNSIIDRGKTEFEIFVNVAESSMSCQTKLDQVANKITITQEENKCNILKNSELTGEASGIAGMTNAQYIIIGNHIAQFLGYETHEGRTNARFLVDGKEIETEEGIFGSSDKVNFVVEELECGVIMKQGNFAEVYKSKKCQIKSKDEVLGRTDILIIATIPDVWKKDVTLKKGMHTVINQEVIYLKDIIRDDANNLFYPVFEIKGEESTGAEVSQSGISVFGK